MRYEINPRIAYRKIDGRMVIVNPQNDEMMTLNETGSLIFERIGTMSVDAIVNELRNLFEVEAFQAQQEVDAFIRTMVDEGLVVPCP